MNNDKNHIGDVNSNEKGSGARYNGGKVDYSYIPLSTLDEEAKVWMAGAAKYKRFNWAKGMSWSAVLASLMRHLAAWQSGEDLDPETGLSHLGHAACNLRMLTLYAKTYPEGDDRPKEWIAEYRGEKKKEILAKEIDLAGVTFGEDWLQKEEEKIRSIFPDYIPAPRDKCGSGFERDEKMGWPEHSPLVSVTGGSDVQFVNCTFYSSPVDELLITSDEPLPDIFPVDPEELT